MQCLEIIEIKESNKEKEVNELLRKGWVLLSVGFYDEGVPGYQYHTYSLGLPESVKKAEKILSTLGF